MNRALFVLVEILVRKNILTESDCTKIRTVWADRDRENFYQNIKRWFGNSTAWKCRWFG